MINTNLPTSTLMRSSFQSQQQSHPMVNLQQYQRHDVKYFRSERERIYQNDLQEEERNRECHLNMIIQSQYENEQQRLTREEEGYREQDEGREMDERREDI
mmetsp:Transcript_58768/g.70077  ORF Transcript_58768/g.70077 Transcript_58768/m.70077 type:complete len:101 (-) Transcript_58768:185-487(-)